MFVKQAKSDSQQISEGKNHDIEKSHSKRWSKTSTRIYKIGNYFWDNTIKIFYAVEREPREYQEKVKRMKSIPRESIEYE